MNILSLIATFCIAVNGFRAVPFLMDDINTDVMHDIKKMLTDQHHVFNQRRVLTNLIYKSVCFRFLRKRRFNVSGVKCYTT